MKACKWGKNMIVKEIEFWIMKEVDEGDPEKVGY